MKIIETNFRKDVKGRNLTTVTLSMGALDGYAAESIEGFTDRLTQILPDLQIEKNPIASEYGKGASIARLIAHISLTLQSEIGSKLNYWQIESGKQAGVYKISFESIDETTGEYACRAAFRILRSALYRHRYSISPDVNLLRSLRNTANPAAA